MGSIVEKLKVENLIGLSLFVKSQFVMLASELSLLSLRLSLQRAANNPYWATRYFTVYELPAVTF